MESSWRGGVDGRALIERDGELRVLSELVSDAAAQSGRMVTIAGPPGIGKSAVLAAACEVASEAGLRVLDARGRVLEREFTLGAVRQLFEGTLAGTPARARAKLLSGPAAAAGAVLEGREPSDGAGGASQGLALAHSFYWLVVNLAVQSPVLIAVDDAQWIDELSLRFLAYLCGRLDGLPVAIVLATRGGESSELLDELLGHVAARPLRPLPLSPDGAASLVRESLPGASAQLMSACARASAGNPFLLVELVRMIRAESWTLGPEDAGRLDDVVPETVERSVLARLRTLPGAAVALAGASAVLGDEAPLRHAAGLAGLAADVAVSAADALVRAEIVTGGDPLTFVHPIVRRTIYRELSPVHRADAHLRAARRLYDEHAATEAIAEQLLQARCDGAAWVVDILHAAAATASRSGVPRAAARYLRRALNEPPAAAGRGEILLELSRVESALGDPDAGAHLAEGLECTGDPRRRAEILLATGRWLMLNGRLIEAAEPFAQGLSELGTPALETGDDLALELRARAALAAMYDPARAGEPGVGIDAHEAGQAAPRTDGERTLLVALAGRLLLRGEDRAGAVRLARRAWDDGALLQRDTADSISAYTPHIVLACAGELEEAARMFQAALDEARARGSPIGYATACYYQLHSNWRLGRLSDAVADGQAATEAIAEGWALAGPPAAGVLAMALAERDELESAEAVLARFPPTERAAPDANLAYFYEGDAHVALARGDPQRALTALSECERLTTSAGWLNPAVLDWRSPAALAHAALDDRELAERLAEENVRLARAFGEPRALGIALRTAALVSDGDARGPRLQQAIATLRESQATLELARALLELGAHVRRSGGRAAARQPLREALDLAARCQATALRGRIEAELAASGARPRRTALRGPDSLTPAEHRVAELAARGMTNRQIAQALFVTPKTVEKHIAGTYDKLGVRSRDALQTAFGDHWTGEDRRQPATSLDARPTAQTSAGKA